MADELTAKDIRVLRALHHVYDGVSDEELFAHNELRDYGRPRFGTPLKLSTTRLFQRLVDLGFITCKKDTFGNEIALTKTGRLALMATGDESKEYWWVSVGGAPCEPAVFSAEGIFTIGCPDAHDPDLIDFVGHQYPVPDTPAEVERKRIAWEKKRAEDARKGIHHGYRTFT